MSLVLRLMTILKALITLIFSSKPVHAYVLQVIILANHMNGKDTHVRGLRVLGPVEYVSLFIDGLEAISYILIVDFAGNKRRAMIRSHLPHRDSKSTNV